MFVQRFILIDDKRKYILKFFDRNPIFNDFFNI